MISKIEQFNTSMDVDVIVRKFHPILGKGRKLKGGLNTRMFFEEMTRLGREFEMNFGNTPQKFTSTTISDNKILNILQVTDAGSNIWYEVPYLAQQGIPQKATNPTYNSDSIPYLLSYIETPRRFVTRFKAVGPVNPTNGATV
jgi:hypothetical protein